MKSAALNATKAPVATTEMRDLRADEIEAVAGARFAIDLISRWSGGSGFRVFGRDAIMWKLN